MTLQERLRDRAKKTWLKEIPCDEGVFPIMDLVGEAADALDAKDARIKELEGALLRTGAWEIAPCCICGYNGPGYYQPDTHACANRAREALK